MTQTVVVNRFAAVRTHATARRVFIILDGAPITFEVIVNGIPVYLDNDSLIGLAKGNAARRQRFIAALHKGADLMFSMTNAAEITGPQCASSITAIRGFLDQVGAHWFPVGLDPRPVLNQEAAGASTSQACVSTAFVRAYCEDRTYGYSQGSGKVIDLSDRFFSLSALLDWLQPHRGQLRQRGQALDAALIQQIKTIRSQSDADPSFLDQYFPERTFDPSRPLTFAFWSLVRCLVAEAKAYHLKNGDGLDFCHAVMGTAFASFATLDKQWKRRVESLPKPNQLARVYYQPKLDQLVTDVESAVAVLHPNS